MHRSPDVHAFVSCLVWTADNVKEGRGGRSGDVVVATQEPIATRVLRERAVVESRPLDEDGCTEGFDRTDDRG